MRNAYIYILYKQSPNTVNAHVHFNFQQHQTPLKLNRRNPPHSSLPQFSTLPPPPTTIPTLPLLSLSLSHPSSIHPTLPRLHIPTTGPIRPQTTETRLTTRRRILTALH